MFRQLIQSEKMDDSDDEVLATKPRPKADHLSNYVQIYTFDKAEPMKTPPVQLSLTHDEFMNYDKNSAMLDYEYLIENGEKPLSWLQVKFQELYLKMFPKVQEEAEVDYETFYGSQKQCEQQMTKYGKVLLNENIHFDDRQKKLLGDMVKNKSCGCSPGTDSTWAVENVVEPDWGPGLFPIKVYYPNNNKETFNDNKNKWECRNPTDIPNNFFPEILGSNNKLTKWREIPYAYHHYWRNKLIPSHEIMHRTKVVMTDDAEKQKLRTGAISGILSMYKLSGVKSIFSTTERTFANVGTLSNEFFEEWTSSAANLNIFITDLRLKFDDTSDNIYKLEAIAGALYVATLLNNIKIANSGVKSVNETYDLLDEWSSSVLTVNPLTPAALKGKFKQIDAICGSSTWKNTYAKHLLALEHCHAFSKNASLTYDFIGACVSDTVFNTSTFSGNVGSRFTVIGGKYENLKGEILKINEKKCTVQFENGQTTNNGLPPQIYQDNLQFEDGEDRRPLYEVNISLDQWLGQTNPEELLWI